MSTIDLHARPIPKAEAPAHNLGGNYPETWEDYVGQERAKEQLKTLAHAARLLGQPMAHTLITSGTPGIGKTALALLTAQEVGARQIKVVTGKMSAGEARLLLAGMDDGDVLFLDEVHMMVAGGKAQAEWLLNFLQDGVITRPGRGAEVQPKVTVLAATTDAGRLPRTLRERFSEVELDPYAPEEAARIALKTASAMFPKPMALPSAANCVAIARAASNNPRIMGQVLKHVRNICLDTDGGNWTGTEYDLTQALDWSGLSPSGLTRAAERYLVALHDKYQGAPAGKAAMEDILQEPGGLAHVERLLVEMDLIDKTPKGRELTSAGARLAKELLR